MIEIIYAQSGEALEHFIDLTQEYLTWMIAEIKEHYPELDIREFISEHAYDDIRKKFLGEHISPYGCLLIAKIENKLSGCVALAKLSKEIAEMQTMYVKPEFRGMGVGKKLAEASISEASRLGYSYLRLDTLGFMNRALNLYRSLGFHDTEPYRDISAPLRRYVCFLELKLAISQQ